MMSSNLQSSSRSDGDCPVVFRCHVDKLQYRLPSIILGIYLLVIFFASPSILWGIFGVLFSAAPFAAVLIAHRVVWRSVQYTIAGGRLTISSYFRTKTIDISTIKKIRRGKFWVERGRNYSASRIKLRIVYANNQYLYVSPENDYAFVDLLQSLNPNIAYSSERNC